MTIKFAGKLSRLTFPFLRGRYAPITLGGREVCFPRR